jgi:glycosyltransferase involved in cell wall biosynthesis
MSYVFLTACRNEEAILGEFLEEFEEAVTTAGVASSAVLYVVDDLSTDRSVEILEEHRATKGTRPGAVRVEVIRAPTNLGNQGALFFGLSHIEVGPDDVLITFDCDGEDDVRQIASIIAVGAENPGKVVLIERGRRRETTTFKVAFSCYKMLFRFLTRQDVIPNNFLLIPGRYVPVVLRTPLAAVHFAYAILRTKFPSVATQRDRRSRYGGRSSQNLFMVASHGLVGLMVFYETVIAKLLLLLAVFGMFSLGVVGLALALPEAIGAQRTLLWVSVATAGVGVGFFSLLLASALALIFKLAIYTLNRLAVEGRAGLTPRRVPAATEPHAAPPGIDGRRAS